jgi:hypothetical protein
MRYVATSHPTWRCPRARLADMTPAVLRLSDGSGLRGTLQTISMTGGLLNVSNPLNRGSRVKVMFLTHSGPVSGSAEMLTPISTKQQAFRFVSLEESAQRRLRAVVQSSLDTREQEWIEKYRAAVSNDIAPRRQILKVVIGALALATICLGSAIYFLHIHLLK